MTTSVDVDRVLISAEKLRHKIAAGRDVVLLDVRREAAGHLGQERLLGAHRVALTTDLTAPPTPELGNLPLPTEQQLQDAVRRWGIDAESLVVAYSQENPALAARAWWTLKWAGVPDVRVLDGRIAQWTLVGGDLESDIDAGSTEVAPGTFVVRTGSLPTLDAEAAASIARAGVLVDARAEDGYTGIAGGGHIPGALSLPAHRLLDQDGRLANDDELRQLSAAVGAGGTVPIGAYCGGGTSATLTVLVLAKIGVPAALYPGSFSAWSSDSSRPVATGTAAG